MGNYTVHVNTDRGMALIEPADGGEDVYLEEDAEDVEESVRYALLEKALYGLGEEDGC